jgi:hypothetical protein
MKKMNRTAASMIVTAIVILVSVASVAVAGGWLDPVRTTFTGAPTSHTWTNGTTRFWISSLWVESSVAATMTVSVVHNTYTNEIIGSTTGTVASYQEPAAVSVEPDAVILISDGAVSNDVKLSVFRTSP